MNTSYEAIRYDHTVVKTLTNIHVGTPFLVLIVILIMMKTIKHHYILDKFFKKDKLNKLERKLNAESFFSSLTDD